MPGIRNLITINFNFYEATVSSELLSNQGLSPLSRKHSNRTIISEGLIRNYGLRQLDIKLFEGIAKQN